MLNLACQLDAVERARHHYIAEYQVILLASGNAAPCLVAGMRDGRLVAVPSQRLAGELRDLGSVLDDQYRLGSAQVCFCMLWGLSGWLFMFALAVAHGGEIKAYGGADILA